MKKLSLLGLTVLMAVLLPAAATPASTAALHESATNTASIDPLIYEQLATSPDGRAGFFVLFSPQADLSPAFQMADWDLRGRFVYETLQETAGRSQERVRTWLEARGVDYKPLIINNSLFVQADESALRELAAFPEVTAIRGNYQHSIPYPSSVLPSPDAPNAVTWNISHIGADQVWNDFGIKGQGIVVAEMTTGVEYTHPALLPNYKCAGLITHTACWEDPLNTCPGDVPCDNVGHGTFLAGVVAGDDDPGLTWNAGVAPDAQWIACKGCEPLGCSDLALISCADWFIAPGGNPDDRPHIIDGGWGGAGCNGWFMPYISAWQAAGIFSTFTPGHNPATCGTIGSPADYPNTMATGGTNENDVHTVSSMGPSCFGGIKPEVSAPGTNIWSAAPGNGWNCWNTAAGANSHTAGVAALLYEAAPDLIGDFFATRQAITSTAICIEDLTCGGFPCPGGNNVYGWGIIDAYAAISAIISDCSPVTLTDFVWTPLTPTVGQDIAFQASASGTMPITYTWNLGDGTTAQGQVVSHSYALSGSYVVVVTATNCGTSTASAAHTVTIAPCNPVTAVDFGWQPPEPEVGQEITLTAWVLGGGGWLTETVDQSGDVGLWSSLAADTQGRLHVAYFDYSNFDLRYALYDHGTWVTETVVAEGSAGWSSFLTLDAADRPHIAYGNDSTLEYAYYDGTTWITDTADSQGGGGIALVLDAQGYPHISYYRYYAMRYAWFDGTAWFSESLDISVIAEHTSLALDAQGRPHISYNDTDNLSLKHAWHNGSTWKIETVDSTGRVGQDNSLVLDSQGHLHISYSSPWGSSPSGDDLKYAYHDGENWQIEVVDSSGAVGRHTSLALDQAGRPHISYCAYDESSWICEALRVAHYNGSTWITETIDQAGQVGAHTSLAIDPAGRMHISYQDEGNWDLRHAWQDVSPPSPPLSFTWNLGDGAVARGEVVHHSFALPGDYPIVVTATNCGTATATAEHTITVSPCEPVHDADFTWTPLTPTLGEMVVLTATAWSTESDWISETASSRRAAYLSMALDGEGHPHISHQGNGSSLVYWYHDGSTWISQTVDNDGNVGRHNSLALDGANRAHISYAFWNPANADYNLKYAHYDGSDWQIEVVVMDGRAGMGTSLALDSADHPHIAYYNLSDHSLNYASHDGTAWQFEVVGRGQYPSLALDASDRPHISYFDNTPSGSELNYAHFDGSGWITETVSSSWELGPGVLALDTANHPHIAFTDDDHLLHGRYDGSLWHVDLVDDSGNSAYGRSLVIDKENIIHISYSDTSSGQLQYGYNDGTGWSTQVLDWREQVAETAIALDASGRPHIAYEGSYNLRYAWQISVPVAASPPISYTWDLGNGTTAQGQVVSHSYDLPGVYSVSLTATNCGTATATAEHTITVALCELAHAAAFSWAPLTPTLGQATTFTASASGTPPISYTWDLGDGSTTQGQVVGHSYDQPGTYTVVLTASNCGGAGLATATQALTILPPACQPVTATDFFWTPLTPTVGEIATFTASASGDPPISYTWDMGDGTMAMGDVVSHTYGQAGTYTVVLTATNACGHETVYRDLAVKARSWRIYLPLVLRQ